VGQPSQPGTKFKVLKAAKRTSGLSERQDREDSPGASPLTLQNRIDFLLAPLALFPMFFPLYGCRFASNG
jgi:hypothetical protein